MIYLRPVMPGSQIYHIISFYMESTRNCMLRKSGFIVFTGILALLISGCSTVQHPTRLTVKGANKVTYITGNGDHIIARYFSLSDGTLDFVKVILPDNKEYTLPQVMSASGVRYTDDRELVWWTKADSAFAEVRDGNGQWIRKYECREIHSGK